MIRIPKIEWNEEVATAEVYPENKTSDAFTIIIDCKNKKVLRTVPEDCDEILASYHAKEAITQSYDAGHRPTSIPPIYWY